MNFKILVLASLLAAAVVADDTFLMDSDFGRYLSANYTFAQTATACTADSACAGTTGSLTSCCATWTRNSTTAAKYCLPVVQLGAIFTYNYTNFTASGCTTTATTATSAGAACT